MQEHVRLITTVLKPIYDRHSDEIVENKGSESVRLWYLEAARGGDLFPVLERVASKLQGLDDLRFVGLRTSFTTLSRKKNAVPEDTVWKEDQLARPMLDLVLSAGPGPTQPGPRVDASHLRRFVATREEGIRAQLPRQHFGLAAILREVLAVPSELPPLYRLDAAEAHVHNLVARFGGSEPMYIGLTSRPAEERWVLRGREGRAHCDVYSRMLLAVQGPGEALRELERRTIGHFRAVAPLRLRNVGPGGEGISDQNPRVVLYVCVGRR